MFYSYTQPLILGNSFDITELSNQLVTMDITNGQTNFLGKPFGNETYCGANIPHGAFDPTSQYYYTMCCLDFEGCETATLNVVGLDGSMIKTYPLTFAQQVKFGLFVV